VYLEYHEESGVVFYRCFEPDCNGKIQLSLESGKLDCISPHYVDNGKTHRPWSHAGVSKW
jgi:hypothetical protein